jgi:protein TonB
MSRVIASLLLSVGCATAIAQGTSRGPTDEELGHARQVLAEQRVLLESKRREIESMPDSPQKERARTILDEIEKRLNATPVNVYVTNSSKMTDAMRSYYERFVRRVEDCGTRHFPKASGKSLYGEGVISAKVGKDGALVGTEIERSSGKPALDAHMKRVVRASSPFGPLPKEIFANDSAPYTNAVIIVAFNFQRDESASPTLPENERCRWK